MFLSVDLSTPDVEQRVNFGFAQSPTHHKNNSYRPELETSFSAQMSMSPTATAEPPTLPLKESIAGENGILHPSLVTPERSVRIKFEKNGT